MKQDLTGKFVVAYDTICDGQLCTMQSSDIEGEDDHPVLYNSEDEAFSDIFFDAHGMLAHREAADLEEMEITQELVDQMSKVYDSKDVAAMRKMLSDHPELNYNEEWVEPAETFIMNRKALYTGEAVQITGKPLNDEQ